MNLVPPISLDTTRQEILDDCKVIYELAQRRLAIRNGFKPKGERAAFFAPKTDWLGRNEDVALALGKAQIAARLLDDQRIEVLSVHISGETAVLTVSHAPDQASVQGAFTMRSRNGADAKGVAMIGHGEHAVLVEWAL